MNWNNSYFPSKPPNRKSGKPSITLFANLSRYFFRQHRLVATKENGFERAISILRPISTIFDRFILIWWIFSYLYDGKNHPNKMPTHMNRIKEVLEEKGIKQTWQTEKLGKSFSIVNAYACNRCHPTSNRSSKSQGFSKSFPKI